jgi:protein arginine kinase
MNWYCEPGKENDVVLSTRIKLSRNFADIPFIAKATEKDLQNVVERMQKILPKLGYGLKLQRLKDMDLITKQSLLEKNLVNQEFISDNTDVEAICINDEENICIMLNELDHIEIQVFNSGLEIDNSFNLISEIDQKLRNEEKIAFDKKFGYLTSDLVNVGTGMKASILVHLPGLKKTGNLQKILDIVENFGMNIRNEYGEYSKKDSDVYQISNRQTLGISEKDTIANLKIITEKIVEQERIARKFLAENSKNLEDSIYRSLGILLYAKRMSLEESNKLISEVKLGVDLGILLELTDIKIKKMLLYTKPANLQKYLGRILTKDEMQIERAKILQNIIKEN